MIAFFSNYLTMFSLFLILACMTIGYMIYLNIQEKHADIEFKRMLVENKDLSHETKSQLIQDKFFYDNTKKGDNRDDR